MKLRRNLDAMVPLGMTAMEQDIDSRVRKYFSPDNRWDVQLRRRFKCGYEYKPRQMVPLYQAYWEYYFGEEQS
jgi:hypothetical protein